MINNNIIDFSRAFYTIYEFSNILGVHHNTIRRSIKSGKIQAFRIGKGIKSSWRIPNSEINRMCLVDLDDIVENIIKERKDKI